MLPHQLTWYSADPKRGRVLPHWPLVFPCISHAAVGALGAEMIQLCWGGPKYWRCWVHFAPLEFPGSGRPSCFFKERGGHTYWWYFMQREWKYSDNLLGMSRRGGLCIMRSALCMETAIAAKKPPIFLFSACWAVARWDPLTNLAGFAQPAAWGPALLGQRTQPASSETGPADSAVLAAVTNPVFECSLPAEFALLLLWGVKWDQ